MSTKTYLLSFLFPQFIEEVASFVNGKIKIELVRGHYRSSVAGFWQSGDYAKNILNLALNKTKFAGKKIKKALILGLGCGSWAEVLNGRFPDIHIVGVEIDATMIVLGKKYFGLDKIPNLELVNSDANLYVNNIKTKSYDLIAGDLFIGCRTPAKFDSRDFTELIFAGLTSRGVYISNRSYLQEFRKETDKFLKLLRMTFPLVKTVYKHPNLIIIGYKKALKNHESLD